MQSFRLDWLSDWKMKTIDTVGHIILGIAIWYIYRDTYSPWSILVQWLPDMFMYPRWFYCMITGRYLLKNNPLRFAHMMVHSSAGLAIAAFVILIGLPTPIVGLQIASHLLWDLFTHKGLKKYQL